MRKYTIIVGVALLITLLVSLLFFTQPGTSLLSKLPYTGDLYSKGSIIINSGNSVATILIDGEDYGETSLELTDLEPGSHSVTLTRKTSSESNFYKPQTFFIDLQPNTEAVINVEIGPDENLSGHVLYYTLTPGKTGKGLFTVSGNPKDSLLNVDGKFFGTLPISAEEMSRGEHTFEVIREGYESIDFPVIIRENYNLNITAFLMPIPINIERARDVGE